jgi:serine/threonine protein kinase
MPYQEGPTLAEYVKEQRFSDETSFEQIAFARKIALNLAIALDGLSDEIELGQVKPEHQHLDLSPSNIIMAPGITAEEDREIRFIDLGQNFLYTRQIGMADHDDAAYIAPEVKNRSNSSSSDLYSLAIIVIELLSGVKSRDGRVPDVVYEISPTLGRQTQVGPVVTRFARSRIAHRHALGPA